MNILLAIVILSGLVLALSFIKIRNKQHIGIKDKMRSHRRKLNRLAVENYQPEKK